MKLMSRPTDKHCDGLERGRSGAGLTGVRNARPYLARSRGNRRREGLYSLYGKIDFLEFAGSNQFKRVMREAPKPVT